MKISDKVFIFLIVSGEVYFSYHLPPGMVFTHSPVLVRLKIIPLRAKQVGGIKFNCQKKSMIHFTKYLYFCTYVNVHLEASCTTPIVCHMLNDYDVYLLRVWYVMYPYTYQHYILVFTVSRHKQNIFINRQTLLNDWLKL